MTNALSHITFVVADLERTANLFKTIFNAEEVYSSANKAFSIAPEKFFLIGNLWIAIMQGEPLNERSYNHIAFKLDEPQFDDYLKRINDLGLEVKPPRPRVPGEGRSIYFYDYDNHLLELHTGTLTERLNRYASTKEAAQ